MAKFVGLVAVIIAACAAYFSIYGLAHIFSAAFISVVIMGSILEIGKLTTASFLYRFWNKIGFFLKSYLMLAMAALMLITSIGTYGYLTSAWQTGNIDLTHVEQRVSFIDEEIDALKEQQQRISDDIDRTGANYITKRMELIEQYQPQREKIQARLAELRKKRLDITREKLEVEAHTGPIKFVADLVNAPAEQAIMWLTVLIVIVFDPLAVALTVAANVIAVSNKKKLLSGSIDSVKADAISTTLSDSPSDLTITSDVRPQKNATPSPIQQNREENSEVNSEEFTNEELPVVDEVEPESESESESVESNSNHSYEEVTPSPRFSRRVPKLRKNKKQQNKQVDSSEPESKITNEDELNQLLRKSSYGVKLTEEEQKEVEQRSYKPRS